MSATINDSKIRVAGHELTAAIHLITQARSIINDTLKEASTELAYADPYSDQGKSLESIVIALGRLSDGLGHSTRLYDCCETMQSFGIGAAAKIADEHNVAIARMNKKELSPCHP